MPLGIQRLNARHQQPNSRIVFIKPLAGPDRALAQDFLERIAAISQPIMKAHHLSIMTLEEHEPNTEFVGRNFNAGEVIQLVLKAPFTGRWLPFRSVQMVMMHELAHCVQMNHSGAFWKVRDGFAGELRALWARGYSGDGFWSRGKTVLSGEYEGRAGGVEEEVVPRSLCGGTFRSRRGKRKRRGTGTGDRKVETLTYAERQQRRIARKFGTNGVALGDDVEARVKLEEGRRPKGKPRVAGSARGRELRAAAALARFGQQKEEVVKKEEEQGSGSETESEYEEVKVKEEAVDVDGSKMLDGNGRALVRVCEDEDKASVEVQREMKELQELSRDVNPKPLSTIKQEDESTASEDGALSQPSRNTTTNSKSIRPKIEHSDQPTQSPLAAPKAPTTKKKTHSSTTVDRQAHITCPICSLTNDPASPTCSACAHVLNPSQMPTHWRCSSPACSGSLYLNAGDCGICGVCGTKRVALVGD